MPAGAASRPTANGFPSWVPGAVTAAAGGLVLLSFTSACESDVVVGDWPCSSAPIALLGAAGAGGEERATNVPISVPWSTGFEDGFCGYATARGYCYGDPATSHTFSSAHVHGGRVAAAFRLSTDNGIEQQTRCVREGILPDSAYYGAWFMLPEASVSRNWNLMHFRGSKNGRMQGLWDVSVDSTDDGRLYLYVYDFFRRMRHERDEPITVEPGSWFHVVFYLKRAADASGEIALLQDGREVTQVSMVTTDDSSWGQWYVGNLAGSVTPPDVTVYVDDVSIDTKP